MEPDYEAIQLAHDRQTARVAPASAQAYRADVKRMARADVWPEDIAGCLRTYYRYVAALTYWAAETVIALTPQAVRSAMTASQGADFRICASVLKRYPPAAPDVPPSKDPRRRRARPPRLPRRGHQGKRRVSKCLARSEREREGCMFAKAQEQAMAPEAIALVRTLGVMPAEIERSVHVQRIDDEIWVTISGAKVNSARQTGQESRTVAMAPDSPEAAFLFSSVPLNGDAVVVQCDRKRLHRAIKDAAIAGLGRRLGQKVSAYAFRHRATSRLRVQLSRVELAGVRGDRSTRTAAEYGGGHGGHHGPRLGLVDCSFAIREHAQPPCPLHHLARPHVPR